MNQPRRVDGPPPLEGDGFAGFGRHRLRTPNGAIIEFPVSIVPESEVWVATIWPDRAAPGVWCRQVWQPDPIGRGWVLPLEIASCDVVEFGADTAAGPVRWYGVLRSYEVDTCTTLQGPYRCPDDAWIDARRLLAAVRHDPHPREQANSARPTNQPVSRLERCRHHRPIRPRRGSSPI